MSDRLDHTLGRLDALFEEVKRLQKEIEAIKLERGLIPHDVAPTTVRWVMWRYDNTQSCFSIGGHLTDVFTRKKIGEVVAVQYDGEPLTGDWVITFGGRRFTLTDVVFQALSALLDKVGERQ